MFRYVFVAQKHQLFLNLIFCEINVIHNISCKTEEAEIRKASNYLDRPKKAIIKWQVRKLMGGIYRVALGRKKDFSQN